MDPAASRTARALEELITAHPASNRIFEHARASGWSPGSPAFRGAYAAVTRRLGGAAGDSVVAPAELAAAARPHWTLTDWTRAWLLVQSLAQADPAEHLALVTTLFEGGEIGEQESLLRTLPLLPETARFVTAAILACRTNARRVFEAIACENAYPAAFFPELAFNQMVLKAIFIEVAARRIEGLSARNGPELRRMARDYESERRAAGRAVPADIAFILAGADPSLGGAT